MGFKVISPAGAAVALIATHCGGETAPAPDTRTYFGDVTLQVSAGLGSPPFTTATASFSTRPAAGPSECFGTVVGSCCYVSSPSLVTDGGVMDAGVEAFATAGVLTIKDGANTAATLIPLPDSEYRLQSSPTWTAGDILSVSAAGGVVPAFVGSVQAPVPFANLAPSSSTSAPLTIDRSKDFIVNWTPLAGATVSIVLQVTHSALDRTTITCEGPDTGTMTVSKSLLSMGDFITGKLPPEGPPSVVGFRRWVTTDVSSGNARVTLVSLAEFTENAAFQ